MDELYKQFNWYEDIGHHATAWEGHILWAYNTVKEWKPKIIVELGVYLSHSLSTMAEACLDADMDTKLYGIDHFKGDEHSGFFGEDIEAIATRCLSRYPNVTLIKKNFNDALVEWDKREDKTIDLLHIDGRHFYEDIKEDFENWSKFVPEGGHIILHDTQVTERGFGIKKYFEELQDEHSEWEFNERLESNGLGIIQR